MTTISNDILMGELRSAVAATAEDFSHIGRVVWAIVLLKGELRDAALQKMNVELANKFSNNAAITDWISWAVSGAPALAARLEDECDWIEKSDLAAAEWLAAWTWQGAVNQHADPAHTGMHVCLGLGGLHAEDDPPNAYLAMEWDVSHRFSSVRHISIRLREGGLQAGALNTGAALQGYPGLPDHLPSFADALAE